MNQVSIEKILALETALRVLLEAARKNGDPSEYYRLGEELKMVLAEKKVLQLKSVPVQQLAVQAA